jgi:hypothetical protein
MLMEVNVGMILIRSHIVRTRADWRKAVAANSWVLVRSQRKYIEGVV